MIMAQGPGATSVAPEATNDEKHRAALAVVQRATDPDDALELLRMLGLADSGFHFEHRWVRRGTAARVKVQDAP